MNSTTRKQQRTNLSDAKPKIFVLDTNVPMHDPLSIFGFHEHDVFIPVVTLGELDDHKKGNTEVARNVREATRRIDDMLEAYHDDIALGVPLNEPSQGTATGRLFLQTEEMNGTLPESLPKSKNDHQILSVVMHLKKDPKNEGRLVILVSKDLNMRIKARTLGIAVQDYLKDKVLEDSDLLYTGMCELPNDFFSTHGEDLGVEKVGPNTVYRVQGPLCPSFHVNQLVWSDEYGVDAVVRSVSGQSAILQTFTDYSSKHTVWGINARNRGQNFALNLLMNPKIDFVTLLGQAGTGKTLLTLAAGLMQSLEENRYSEIIMTRVTVPMGEDIGFLPGSEEEKMIPWMGALEDNLDVLSGGNSSGEKEVKENGQHKPDSYSNDWGRAATHDLMRSRIKVKSLNFMRGRTFLNKFVIIDEAQNLTPKQMKALITRAGPGTKIVCLGNLSQIDTPYLTEGSSGLAVVVDRFKGWEHGAHVILERGERSRLADHANEVL